MERERIASRRHAQVTPADKRKHIAIERAFDTRPPFIDGTPRCTRVLARCQETAAKKAVSSDASSIVARQKIRETRCSTVVAAKV